MVVADLLSFYCRYDRSRYGTDGGPLHDPCVIAHLLDSALFACRHVNVQIEIASPLTLGQTVADWWQSTEAQPNCHVAYAVDDEAFFSQLTQKLSTLP